MIRVNIGCGQQPTPGYLNFDNSLSVRLAKLPPVILKPFLRSEHIDFIAFARLHNIQFADAGKHIPLPDSSADVIYSSHMFEHLDRQEAANFLREARRVLIPAGVLRLAIPDLAYNIARYHKEGAEWFMENLHTCVPKPKGIKGKILDILAGHRQHNWMYDAKSLSELLTQNGFVQATVLERGQTTIADPANLNLSQPMEGTMFVEAIKAA
jgi:predicted SAM-dependent methyltransferase